MKNVIKTVLTCSLLIFSASIFADDVDGEIEAIDAATQSFTVQGITFQTTDKTDYDDGLKNFKDLQVGQRVEVDFDYRDGKHYAREIELDD